MATLTLLALASSLVDEHALLEKMAAEACGNVFDALEANALTYDQVRVVLAPPHQRFKFATTTRVFGGGSPYKFWQMLCNDYKTTLDRRPEWAGTTTTTPTTVDVRFFKPLHSDGVGHVCVSFVWN